MPSQREGKNLGKPTKESELEKHESEIGTKTPMKVQPRKTTDDARSVRKTTMHDKAQ